MTLQRIEADGELLALIARKEYKSNVLEFVSDESYGFKIFTEIKNLNPCKIYFVKKGKVGCDIYDNSDKKINYVHLVEGDLIVFVSGGHGVDFLEPTEMIEIKQGPYRGPNEDKRFFEDKIK